MCESVSQESEEPSSIVFPFPSGSGVVSTRTPGSGRSVYSVSQRTGALGAGGSLSSADSGGSGRPFGH